MSLSDEALQACVRAHGIANAEAFRSSLDALPEHIEWLGFLEGCSSPEAALFQWGRLLEAHPDLLAEWESDYGARFGLVLQRLTRIFGHSRALGDYLVGDPTRIHGRWLFPPLGVGADSSDVRGWVAQIFSTVGEASPDGQGTETIDALRRAYRQCLLGIVAADLSDPQPTDIVMPVGAAMATLVDEVIDTVLRVARQRNPQAASATMAIIAMGKTGACELNYISDVDVVYVCADTEQDLAGAAVLASDIALILSAGHLGGVEEPLWVLDTALRPEGKDGALVRTLPSYITYWEKWAQTWEFQALLKARACAGDPPLGADFEAAAATFVWSASGRAGFVEDARAMRRRVEGTVPPREAPRELKLGKGGLRDVEFSVQMLQLVHGRTDPTLHVRPTLDAIDALCRAGYVSRSDAQELHEHYRFLRAVEHRTQLLRMRRTHVLPQQASSLRMVARSLGFEQSDDLMARLRETRGRVRALHEDMFYRPIVEATAGLSADSMRLARDLHESEGAMNERAAQERLAAIGFIDTRGALGHIRALSQGTSRRAQIQRHLLPVFLGWLSDSVDPDMGLLHFRTLSDRIGDSHWYLRLLRDSSSAAQRLLQALSRSKWLAHSLELRPEAVQWLDNDHDLAPIDPDRLRKEVCALVDRRPDPEDAALRVRAVRMRELTRSALADTTFGMRAINPSIAQATDVALDGALLIAQREDEATHGSLVDMAFIAMGRYGGRESGYASDADVMVAHLPREGVSEQDAAAAATRITHQVQRLLGTTASHAGVTVDADLRPEGKNGPMSRTPESFAEYYERWAATWERQALLRARPAAGDPRVCQALVEIIDPIRYGAPPSAANVQEIRLLKARMERERLPRGVDPKRHVKLGPGGLSDVEWTIQLLQMQHAHRVEGLRTPSTLEALDSARKAGLMDPDQASILKAAWTMASKIRSANVLVSGRMSGQKLDQLPTDRRDLAPLAYMLGYESGSEREVEEDWLRTARQARRVMDDIFWP